jgi:hypothetical protein
MVRIVTGDCRPHNREELPMNKYTVEMLQRLTALGISLNDAYALRRIAMTLHRWHELECGDGNDYASWCITRGRKEGGEFVHDDNGAPYEERHVHSENKARYTRIPDRERGATKRLLEIMARYPNLAVYIQTDPRGAPLYILDRATTPQPYEQFYSRGVAVFK